MTHFIVTYSYLNAPDALDEVRPEHRAYLRTLADRGLLVASGPFTDEGPSGAGLIFQADSVDEVTAALADDPFQREGLLLSSEVRTWNPVIGIFA